MTQKDTNQVTALAIPQSEEGMLARAQEAAELGMLRKEAFSSNLNPAEFKAVAMMALAYGLDPLMGELVVLHGKPIPTIHARRRKDFEAGHRPNIKFRPLTSLERAELYEADVLSEGDLAGWCVLTTEWGNSVEAFAKVSREERERPNKKGDGLASPVVAANPIEMWQKRAEARAREMAYGGLAMPQLFEIKGEPKPMAQDTPWCVEHGQDFNKKSKSGKSYHIFRDGWCVEGMGFMASTRPPAVPEPAAAPAPPPKVSPSGVSSGTQVEEEPAGSRWKEDIDRNKTQTYVPQEDTPEAPFDPEGMTPTLPDTMHSQAFLSELLEAHGWSTDRLEIDVLHVSLATWLKTHSLQEAYDAWREKAGV